MQAHALRTDQVGAPHMGWVLAHEVRSRSGSRLLRKGAILDAAALRAWADVQPGEVHLLEFAPDDVHEDEAGRRIAIAVSGDGINTRGPFQSRYNLVATRKGLLRVDIDLLRAVNAVDGVTVFSLLDRQPVLPGKIVAGVKVTPIGLPESRVAEVERLCAEAVRPPLVVLPFKPMRVSVVATEGLSERMRARFRETVERKMRWYGSTVDEVRFIDSDAQVVAETIHEFIESGSDIVMAAGGNTIDPLDPISLALPMIGARFVHHGAPAHPGSMFWLAESDGVPIVNLASCSMYSRATVADLILPLIMTGQRVTEDVIIDLGYGGLLEREMAFRFPDYDAESSDEAETAED